MNMIELQITFIEVLGLYLQLYWPFWALISGMRQQSYVTTAGV